MVLALAVTRVSRLLTHAGRLCESVVVAALDGKYRARAESYAAFRKLAESDPAKWPAFLQFLAVSFDSEGKAWTVRDSEQALQVIGVSQEDTESVLALHREADEEDYSVQASGSSVGRAECCG